MLDNKSLEVIDRFKQALLTKSLPLTTDSHVLDSNRGKKLDYETNETDALSNKVVEYNGINYLVTSNNQIEKTNKQNKRKWKDYYKSTEEYAADQQQRNKRADTGVRSIQENEDYEDDDDDDDDNDDDEDDNDDNDNDNYEQGEDNEEIDPLHDLDLTEILLSLTHPSEIVSHPAILRTFKLNVLSKLAGELIELIESEHETLNWFYKLLQVLNGEDWYYLLEDSLGLPKYDHGLTNDEKEAQSSSNGAKPGAEDNTNTTNKDGDSKSSQDQSITSGTNEESEEFSKRITRTATIEDDEVTDPFFMLPEALKKYELHQTRILEEPEVGKENELTNVQEDLINYLQVSIQRQQEYIKNLVQLRTAIIRADRLKSTLLKWAKEMYDKKSS